MTFKKLSAEEALLKFNELRELPSENEWVEFKEAKGGLNPSELGKYVSALSNEANLRGELYGWLLLGVNNEHPHDVVGTNHKEDNDKTQKRQVAEGTGGTGHTFLEMYEIRHPDGRGLLFQIPAAPAGAPIPWKGKCWGRHGSHNSELAQYEKEHFKTQMAIESVFRQSLGSSVWLDEARKKFADRCWLFDEVDAWSVHSNERLLLLTGGPGAGKSAFLAELIHRNPEKRILAWHLCRHFYPESRSTVKFIQSLAAMLARNFKDYHSKLKADSHLAEALLTSDPASAFVTAIVTPIGECSPPGDGVWFVVVDALDEADLNPRPSIPSIPDLLVQWQGLLPSWLRIIASIRRGDPLERDVFPGARKVCIDPNGQHGDKVRVDVRGYLEERLEEPNFLERLTQAHVRKENAVQTLLSKSEKNFLYAAEALDGLELGSITFDELNQLPQGLREMFQRFFSRQWPRDEPESFARVRPILEMLVAAPAPVAEELLAGALKKKLNSYELKERLNELAHYILRREDGITLRLLAIREWLTTTDGIYHVTPQKGHKRLANACRKKKFKAMPYSLRHLPYHLAQAEEWDRLAELLTDFSFMRDRVRAGISLHECIADYETFLKQFGSQTHSSILGNAFDFDVQGMGSDAQAPNADKVLQRMRQIPPDLRAVSPGPAVYEKTIPEVYFPSDCGGQAAIERAGQLRQGKPADGFSSADAKKDDTRAEVREFAAFLCDYYADIADTEFDIFALAYASPGARVAEKADKKLQGNGDQPRIVLEHRRAAVAVRSPVVVFGNSISFAGLPLITNRSLRGKGNQPPLVARRRLTDKEEFRFAGNVKSLLVSGNGKALLKVCRDGKLKFWNLTEDVPILGKPIAVESLVQDAAISFNGELLVTVNHKHQLSLWDINTRGHLRGLQNIDTSGPPQSVRALDWKLTFSKNDQLLVGVRQNHLVVWDVASGECLRHITIDRKKFDEDCCFYDVLVTADARIAFTAADVGGLGDPSRILVWDLIGGECLQCRSFGRDGRIAVSEDGRILVTDGQDALFVSDVMTGKRIWSQGDRLVAETGNIISWRHDVLTDSKGQLVFTTEKKDLRPQGWTFTEQPAKYRMPRSSGSVQEFILSNDGRTALSLHQDGWLRRWKFEDGQAGSVSRPHDRIRAFGRSGFLVAGWQTNSHLLSNNGWHIYHMALHPDGWADLQFDKSNSPPRDADFTADGRIAALAYNDGIHIWDFTVPRLVRVIQSHYGKPEKVSLTPDGAKVAACYRDGGEWHIFDVQTGERVGQQREKFSSLGAQDNEPAIPITIQVEPGTNERIISARTHDGKVIARFTAPAAVTCVSRLLPDGRFLCGTSQGEVYFLQLVNIPEIRPTVSAIRRFRFHLDNRKPAVPYHWLNAGDFRNFDMFAAWFASQCDAPADAATAYVVGQLPSQPVAFSDRKRHYEVATAYVVGQLPPPLREMLQRLQSLLAKVNARRRIGTLKDTRNKRRPLVRRLRQPLLHFLRRLLKSRDLWEKLKLEPETVESHLKAFSCQDVTQLTEAEVIHLNRILLQRCWPDDLLLEVSTTLPFSRKVEPLPGGRDKNATAICPWCGDWIEVEDCSSTSSHEMRCSSSTCSKLAIIQVKP